MSIDKRQYNSAETNNLTNQQQSILLAKVISESEDSSEESSSEEDDSSEDESEDDSEHDDSFEREESKADNSMQAKRKHANQESILSRQTSDANLEIIGHLNKIDNLIKEKRKAQATNMMLGITFKNRHA